MSYQLIGGRKVLPIYLLFTIILSTFAGLIIGFTPIAFLPWWLLRLVRLQRAADWYMQKISRLWGWFLIRGWLTRLKVIGKENIPAKGQRICFVSNHQSLADIPLIQLAIPPMTGFVSKKELDKVPFLNLWMRGVKNVSLDRSSPRDSLKAIMKGVEQVKSGYPMLIFPEGTRSGQNGMRAFKQGSFKLALKAKAQIVPVTIDGTHRLLRSKPFAALPFRKVRVVIHPAIDSTALSSDESSVLHDSVWEIVNSGLEFPNSEVLPPKVRPAPRATGKTEAGMGRA